MLGLCLPFAGGLGGLGLLVSGQLVQEGLMSLLLLSRSGHVPAGGRSVLAMGDTSTVAVCRSDTTRYNDSQSALQGTPSALNPKQTQP